MDKVSIIVPVHNTAGYLHKCVESLRNQSLENIEIILVDNLSNDGSSEICDEYARIDSRVKVLHLSIADLSYARNEALKVISGEYVGFIDSDDYIDPTMFEEMLAAMVDHQADFVYCNFLLESEKDGIESPYLNSGKIYVKSKINFLKEVIWEKTSCSVCNKLFRADFFASRSFPEGKVFEDRYVMNEWTISCDKIVWVDKPMYHYVERLTSICHTYSPNNRYHFFLSECSRLFFIEKYHIFEGKELFETRTKILRTCFWLFKEIMMTVKVTEFHQETCNMRNKFKEQLYLRKDEIDRGCYAKIRKIVYFWPLYYLTHFAFRKHQK